MLFSPKDSGPEKDTAYELASPKDLRRRGILGETGYTVNVSGIIFARPAYTV
jgi:hypothetical protein